MEFTVDKHRKTSLQEQIIAGLRQQILSGMLPPGHQLPAVRAMAERLSVNFNTVARAYRSLEQMGLLSTQQGRGTFVLDHPLPHPQNQPADRIQVIRGLRLDWELQAGRAGVTVDEVIQDWNAPETENFSAAKQSEKRGRRRSWKRLARTISYDRSMIASKKYSKRRKQTFHVKHSAKKSR